MITATRVVIGLGGIGMATYGVSLLWDMNSAETVSLVIWMAGGLIAHDALLAPAYSLVGHAGRRVLPPTVWAPVLVASAATLVLVVLAIPVLAPRPEGQTPVNSSLLDRPYGLGLSIAVAIIWVLAAAVAIRNRHSSDDNDDEAASTNQTTDS